MSPAKHRRPVDGSRCPRPSHSEAALALVLLAVGGDPALAQRPEDRARATMIPIEAPSTGGERRIAVRLVVPGLILAEPASEATLAVEVSPAGAAPPGSFIRMRGLPPVAALSEGHAIAPGAWSVPIAALAKLRLIVPVGAAGKSEVTFSLVTIDGIVIAESKTSLVIAAAGLIAPSEAKREAQPSFLPLPPTAALPPPSPPPAPAPQTELPASPAVAPPQAGTIPFAPSARELVPANRQRAEGFMARGEALLKEGNVAAARLFFERAADEGLAEGALAMGATYDQAELARRRIAGGLGDKAAAKRWYERAREMGSPAAAGRIEALERR